MKYFKIFILQVRTSEISEKSFWCNLLQLFSQNSSLNPFLGSAVITIFFFFFFLCKDAKDTFTCVGKFNNGDGERTDVALAMTFTFLDGQF